MKKIFIPALMVILVLSFAFGQKSRNELLSRDVLDMFAGECSGKICFEHIRDLSVFSRWYGSEDQEKAAEQIVRKAKGYGLDDAHVEKFKVDENSYYWMQKPWLAWNCELGELRMVQPFRQLIASYEANSPCVLVNSRDADLEAEVVYVGKGTELKDYEGKDVKGKLVLASGSPWEVSKVALLKLDAAGILWGRGLDRSGFSSNTVYQTRIKPRSDDKSKLTTFGFSLSVNQARSILSLLEKGEKVILQVKIRAEVRVPGYHFGVVATIPGAADQDEEIILTAHLDHPRPGAHDDNSGCATLLEVARATKSLIERKAIEPPRRTIRFYWTPHVWGGQMLFSTYPELLPKTIANINVDCVGLDQTKVSSSLSVVMPPYSRASFLNDIFNNLLDYLLVCNNDQWGRREYGPEVKDQDGSENILNARTIPFLGYSDHIFFNSGTVGIPAVMLIDLPFGSHHSQNDKLELLDPTQLKRISFLVASAVYALASAGPEESRPIIDEIYHRSRTRLEMELKRAKSILAGADRANVEEASQSAANLMRQSFSREIQALSSAKVFIKGDPQASSYLSQALEKMRRFEKECSADLSSFSSWRWAKLGIQPRQPVLTVEELEFQKIVPSPNPRLKGNFGILNEYPVEKYQFQNIDPDHPFYYELLNFMDGRRNLLEIIRAVQAEALSANYETLSSKEIKEYLKLLKDAEIISY